MNYSVIYKYEPPRRLWYRKPEFLYELRVWCQENLQDGFEVVMLFNERLIVNLTDDGDLDLLVLRWGESGDHRGDW